MDRATADALLADAEDARARFRGPDAEAIRARTETSFQSIASAFDWFLDADAPNEALRLAAALVPFWMATGRLAEGDTWFERALASEGTDPRARARGLYEHGYLVFWTGQYERAADRSNEAVTEARRAGDPTVVALALAVLGRIALNADVEEAKRLLLEAIAETDGTDDREGRSSAMHVLGVAHQMSGEFEDARRVMTERIALGREAGNDFLVAAESANLSMVERQLGNLDAAAALASGAIATFHRLGEEMAVAWGTNSLAAVTAAAGDLERAATLLGFAEAGIERAGGEWPPDERQQYEETLATLTAGLAPQALDIARSRGRSLSMRDAVALSTADRAEGAQPARASPA